jgi:hypothetical protein
VILHQKMGVALSRISLPSPRGRASTAPVATFLRRC